MESPSFPYITCLHPGEEPDHLSRKDEVLLHSVLEWFNDEQTRVDQFYDIIRHKHGMSLRIIDWLITNFSRRVDVMIDTIGIPRDLYRDYHKNLTSYNKKNFDPFARRKRICILIFDEQRFSTVGQLNFFRWFISNDLTKFLIANKETIERHMRDHEKEVKSKSKFKLSTIDNPSKKDFSKHKVQTYSGSFKLDFV